MSMNEAVRLSVKFFDEIKGFPRDDKGRIDAPENYKRSVMTSIESMLAGGTDPHQIESAIDQYKAIPDYQQVYSVEDILGYFHIKFRKGTIKEDPDNLIARGRFYFHPRLQVAPPPPTVEILPDGTFKSSYDNDSNFFLEIKERFTIDDLVDYFMEVMEITSSLARERNKGAFRHLLKNYDLDVIMFTIDESKAIAYDLGAELPKKPFDLNDYIEDGIALLEERMNTSYMEGLDHVIPKQK